VGVPRHVGLSLDQLLDWPDSGQCDRLGLREPPHAGQQPAQMHGGSIPLEHVTRRGRPAVDQRRVQTDGLAQRSLRFRVGERGARTTRDEHLVGVRPQMRRALVTGILGDESLRLGDGLLDEVDRLVVAVEGHGDAGSLQPCPTQAPPLIPIGGGARHELLEQGDGLLGGLPGLAEAVHLVLQQGRHREPGLGQVPGGPRFVGLLADEPGLDRDGPAVRAHRHLMLLRPAIEAGQVTVGPRQAREMLARLRILQRETLEQADTRAVGLLGAGGVAEGRGDIADPKICQRRLLANQRIRTALLQETLVVGQGVLEQRLLDPPDVRRIGCLVHSWQSRQPFGDLRQHLVHGPLGHAEVGLRPGPLGHCRLVACPGPFTRLPDQDAAPGQRQSQHDQQQDGRDHHRAVTTPPLDHPIAHARPLRADRLVLQEARQVLGQLPRRVVAPRRVLARRLQHDRLQLRRDRAVQASRWSRLVEGDLPEHLLAVATVHRGAQRHHLVQCHAERVDVSPVIDRDPLRECLLRAHVAHRAQHVARHRQTRLALEVGQAEVGDPALAVLVEQQVRGLDVTVHDAQLVRVVQRSGHLDAETGDRSKERDVADRSSGGRDEGLRRRTAAVQRRWDAGLRPGFGAGRRRPRRMPVEERPRRR
jgi:hypothetical protein